MARYSFHITNCTTFEVFLDDIGYHIPNPNAAKAHGAVVARELAQDEGWDGYSVFVVDEQGNEIAFVTVEG